MIFFKIINKPEPRKKEELSEEEKLERQVSKSTNFGVAMMTATFRVFYLFCVACFLCLLFCHQKLLYLTLCLLAVAETPDSQSGFVRFPGHPPVSEASHPSRVDKLVAVAQWVTTVEYFECKCVRLHSGLYLAYAASGAITTC